MLKKNINCNVFRLKIYRPATVAILKEFLRLSLLFAMFPELPKKVVSIKNERNEEEIKKKMKAIFYAILRRLFSIFFQNAIFFEIILDLNQDVTHEDHFVILINCFLSGNHSISITKLLYK